MESIGLMMGTPPPRSAAPSDASPSVALGPAELRGATWKARETNERSDGLWMLIVVLLMLMLYLGYVYIIIYIIIYIYTLCLLWFTN